jgi:phage repressor protein C with HTH and peptisase S24 domain
LKEQNEAVPDMDAISFSFAGDTGSMYPTIQDGDLLICEAATDDNLVVGQIVIAHFDIYGDGSTVKILKRITKIDENGYFLEGDNTEHSLDSRTFGYVAREDISEVVMYIATYVYKGD